jgi:hypothetical protein
MVDWREIKRQGRGDVHQTMCVPAVYVPTSGAPFRVNVRDHTRIGKVTAKESGAGLAGMLDTTPRLVFDRTEIANPLRGALVVMSESEAYRLGASRPPDPLYIDVPATLLPEAEAATKWDAAYLDLLL